MSDEPIIAFLPKDFSYVIFCVVYTWIMNVYIMLLVGKARKKYDVKYPALYSKTSNEFNCIQRAHQNTLEQLPLFLPALVVVGVAYPRFAAVCGAVFVTSRFFYAWGYATGDPEKRVKAQVGIFGYFGLVLALIYIGFRQCGCLPQYVDVF